MNPCIGTAPGGIATADSSDRHYIIKQEF